MQHAPTCRLRAKNPTTLQSISCQQMAVPSIIFLPHCSPSTTSQPRAANHFPIPPRASVLCNVWPRSWLALSTGWPPRRVYPPAATRASSVGVWKSAATSLEWPKSVQGRKEEEPRKNTRKVERVGPIASVIALLQDQTPFNCSGWLCSAQGPIWRVTTQAKWCKLAWIEIRMAISLGKKK